MNGDARVTACRSCGGGLALLLDLGSSPLANRLLPGDGVVVDEPRYPLELARCTTCSLLQLTLSVAPDLLFRDYVYFSSNSDAMVEHARALSERLTQERQLGASSCVVEVASNDGYLLRHYLERGVRVLGIDPAENVARVAKERFGIDTVVDFFGLELAASLRAQGTRADVLHAHNVVAHVPDINGFVAGVAAVLADDGVAVIEVPYALDMLDACEFDTIYHEHIFYFALTPMLPLFARHGLAVVDVERIAIHGGSLRLFVARAGAVVAASVAALRDQEEQRGINEAALYAGFAARVKTLCSDLRALIEQERKRGPVVAYGASAKGTTLMHAAGIGAEQIAWVVDRSVVKQGRRTPGTQLRIFPTEKLLEDMPPAVLLLTWNFADEILQQQAEYRRRGGRFILPVPVPRVL
ncbi:MAG: class I SAM-dependent methyltransferase [Deltaproteobacteria bacterium]|nr:class I SAM-dependent methyltransferase [Deltaproteobacteria bacterium]